MHDSELDHSHGEAGVVYETRLTSVGIDIGSSTTHLTISQLVVGRLASHFHRKPEVLRRMILYRSPILFTPFRDDGLIDHKEISCFVARCYREAGVSALDVSSGAVICTGEAARRENAKAITEAVAADSGRFVCATAGHHFEALLAAHGSGSVDLSHRFSGPVINLDIGGGTTKRSVIRAGAIESTAAINIGARLIAIDDRGTLVRCEPAGRAIARHAGISVEEKRLDEADRRRIAETMSEILLDFVGLGELGSFGRDLLLTENPPIPHGVFRLVVSGGVSEYFHGRMRDDLGDLGPHLGEALRVGLLKRDAISAVASAAEGIRATVIGAGQFTLHVSGETVHASDGLSLPLSNLAVAPVSIPWDGLTAKAVDKAFSDALGEEPEDHPRAFFFGGPSRFGYGAIEPLADGIAAVCRRRNIRGRLVLVFSQNLAGTLGAALEMRLEKGQPLLCLDELDLAMLDYLDIGPPPQGETFYPVVVKSLVFGGKSTGLKG